MNYPRPIRGLAKVFSQWIDLASYGGGRTWVGATGGGAIGLEAGQIVGEGDGAGAEVVVGDVDGGGGSGGGAVAARATGCLEVVVVVVVVSSSLMGE